MSAFFRPYIVFCFGCVSSMQWVRHPVDFSIRSSIQPSRGFQELGVPFVGVPREKDSSIGVNVGVPRYRPQYIMNCYRPQYIIIGDQAVMPAVLRKNTLLDAVGALAEAAKVGFREV